MSKVSVIVPIYNVEKFIARCVESLMKQTLQEVEYIFVNDATPDNSMEVLNSIIADFPERKDQVKILEHVENKGLPVARNTGLEVATGEYVFHFDSDDYADEDMLDILYHTAQQNNADIVWCDYYITYPDNERYMRQPCYTTPEEALKGMLCGRMKYNVWNKLVRRSLYVENQIRFPDGYAMGEDMTMMMLFPYAKKVIYHPQAFYHYEQGNSLSLSKDYSSKQLVSIKHNADVVMSFLRQYYNDQWELDICAFQLLTKWAFLIDDKKVMYDLWNEWFPEANRFIWKDKNVSFRIRFVEWCAAKRFYWILQLHYWVVIKFLYSIIYK